jgi:predicted glycosyltransferase
MNRDMPNLRALFYSHDTLGLGHMRRSLAISEQLSSEMAGLSTLVLTGSAMAHGFRIPAGTDYIKLPSVRKLDNEVYGSRSLGVPFDVTLRLREELILNVTANYRPNFFFVDNVPLGMGGEVRRTLQYLRAESPDTRIFLNLRDILDDSAYIVPLWRRQGIVDVLDRLYDRIFIYGSADVYDLIREYELPETIREKTLFCGYIPRPVDKMASRRARSKMCGNGEKLILVTAGGGADGNALIENYLHALPQIACDNSVASFVITGPDMEPREAGRLAAKGRRLPHTTCVDFCDDVLAYMDAADLVVSMAGYNTISEILSLRKRAIAVPRVHPRTEQLIRSERLQDLGLLRMIHPAELSPRRLAAEVSESLRAPEPRESPLEFRGVERLAEEIRSMMGANSQEAAHA